MDQIEGIRTAREGFRRLSLTLSLVGLGAVIAVLLSFGSYGLDLFALSGILAAAFFLASNLYFLLVRVPRPWMPIMQAAEVAAIGLIAAVLSDPTSYGGMILVAISLPLLAKHGVIRTRRSMGAVLAGAVGVDTVLSFLLHEAPFRLVIAMAAIAVGAYAIVYYAFYDEIISLLKDVSELRHTAEVSEHNSFELRRRLARARIAHDSARTEANVAEARVRDLEERVAGFEAVASPVEFGQFGLSQREIEVLRILVQTRGRNRDIGDTLGITERTVKSHIYRICNKVGLDTRLELVELFRWNWPEAEPVDDGE